jgi:hypothetical protein
LAVAIAAATAAVEAIEPPQLTRFQAPIRIGVRQ